MAFAAGICKIPLNTWLAAYGCQGLLALIVINIHSLLKLRSIRLIFQFCPHYFLHLVLRHPEHFIPK